jgi:hypothetical protein
MIAQGCDADRSLQCWNLVRALVSAGCTDDEIHTAMPRHQPSVAKYGDRLALEVERVLGKLR